MIKLTKEQEEAIKICSKITEDDLLNCWEGGEKEYKAIQVVLNLIQEKQKDSEEKDKIIDVMADLLNKGLREGLYINTELGSIGFCMCSSKEEIKQYFENQAKM